MKYLRKYDGNNWSSASYKDMQNIQNKYDSIRNELFEYLILKNLFTRADDITYLDFDLTEHRIDIIYNFGGDEWLGDVDIKDFMYYMNNRDEYLEKFRMDKEAKKYNI